MKVFEVNTNNTEKQFLEFSNILYRDDPNRSLPLGSDVAQVFDSSKNSLLQKGKAKRWLVYDNYNLPAGRIAAFYNHEVKKGTSGIGFFECVNDENLASILFKTAINWLKSEGCSSVEAPINFGEKDRFWGLLIKGFDAPNLYLDNYNPAYYEHLFKHFDFHKKDEILTFKVLLSQLPVARIKQIAERLQQRENIYFKSFDFLRVNEMAAHLHAVYTASFKEENRIKHITIDDIIYMINAMRLVVEEKFIWLAYKDNQPIGLAAFMKNLNELNHPSAKAELFVNLKGFALSVLPQYQNRGIELGLCNALYQSLKNDNRNFHFYFSGINSKTTKMISFLNILNGEIVKTHQTFTLNF
jgi:GNAT superfamily N-acetyltransferase